MHEQNAVSAFVVQVGDAADLATHAAVSLSARELAALVLIGNREGCTVNWLHARLGLTQSGAVRLLDRVQRFGLVARHRSAGRREVALALTVKGEEAVTLGTAARGRAIDAQLVGLTPADRETFMTLAARALAGTSRSRDEGDEACRLCDWRACASDCPVDRAVVAADHADSEGG